MQAENFSLSWLDDPRVFAVNRLRPYSDHAVYANAKEAQSGASSLKRSLSGEWRMQYAPCPAQAPADYWREDFDEGGFDWVRVPGHLELQGYGRPQYANVQYPWDGLEQLEIGQVPQKHNATASYVKRFTLSEAEAASRVILTLEGVESSAAVWLNGTFIGYGEDCFTSAHYDVSAAARAGENRLCVRCFQRCSGSWLDDQDFWRFQGIFRDVTLTFEPKAHVADLFVHTPLNDDFTEAKLEVEAELRLPAEGANVALTLTSPKGENVVQHTCAAAEKLNLTFPVHHPLLWSGETPHLYTLTLTLTDAAGQTYETATTEVGFRRFEMKDKLMLLNGKRIVFHGVNRHEFNRDTGRVLTEENMMEDIRLLKRHHINAVRTCHYPDDSRWYKLCDRYGIYLIDETNMETHGTWDYPGAEKDERAYALPGNHPEWRDAVVDRALNMLERDKNHASVLIWSCGNESFGGKDVYDMSEALRQRDPSRVIHYEGITHDERYPDTSDVCSHMYYRPAQIEKYLKGDPRKPFINCEYIHAMGNSLGGMHLYSALEDKYPMYQGGFIWDWVDQGLRIKAPNGEERIAYGGDFGERPTDYNFIGNGVVLADRGLTPKMQEVKFLFQPAEVLPDDTGVTIRNRRLFETLDDLMLAWSTELNGEVMDSGLATLPAIKPDEKAHVELPLELPEDAGEVTLTCRLVAKEDGAFFRREEEVAIGQTILREADMPLAKTPCAEGVVKGYFNVGMHNDKLSALFTFAKNGLTSLKNAAGKEMLLQAPKLSLFRAPTDNDRGNGDSNRQAIWHVLSEHAFMHIEKIDVQPDSLTVVCKYSHPLLPNCDIFVTYVCDEADSVKVTVDYPGAPNQSDLPAFGLSFQLDASLKHVDYYGMGPMETYADRCSGAVLGRYHYEVAENMVPYMKPQECGNRMGVRTLSVTDDAGAGVVVEAMDAPLEISVLPWTAEQIEAAGHYDELQGSCRTVLDIALKRKGVGGDDSWGAPVQPEFCIPSDQPMKFSFKLKVK